MSFTYEKSNNILKQCQVIAENSKCSRRKFGAVLVRSDGVMISGGYNGSPRGTSNCGTDITCLKDLYNEASYASYDYCPAVHAELNAIINAARIGAPTVGCYLFINSINDNPNGDHCIRCKRDMLNAGIEGSYRRGEQQSIVYTSSEVWKKEVTEWMKRTEMEGRIEKRIRDGAK